MIKKEDWGQYIFDLIGTCWTPEEHEGLCENMEFCEELDQQAFCCTQCGWWCEISEESSEFFGLDEWTCIECCEADQ